MSHEKAQTAQSYTGSFDLYCVSSYLFVATLNSHLQAILSQPPKRSVRFCRSVHSRQTPSLLRTFCGKAATDKPDADHAAGNPAGIPPTGRPPPPAAFPSQLQCEYGQGFLLHKPAAADTFTGRLRQPLGGPPSSSHIPPSAANYDETLTPA